MDPPEPPYRRPGVVSVPSAVLVGATGFPVLVKISVPGGGESGFTVIGVPDAACRELRDRVRAALLSSGFSWPPGAIHVELVPHGLTKLGAGLDLAVAVGVLWAMGEIGPDAMTDRAFVGEVGLDGSVRPVPGILAITAGLDVPEVVVAATQAPEAELTGRHVIRPTSHLRWLVDALNRKVPWPVIGRIEALAAASGHAGPVGLDLADVEGQPAGRYALGGRGRRRPPRVAGRLPRVGQDHVGQALAGPVAGPDRRRGAGGELHLLERRDARRRADVSAPGAGTAARRVGGRARPW
jgi:hypothetical protein